MKHTHLIALFVAVIFLTLSCSKEVSLDQIQQRADGLQYAVNEENPFSGIVIESYRTKQKKSEEEYKNGLKDGRSTFWYENGQKKSDEEYKNGLKDGRSTFWYENGRKEYEEEYKNDLNDGNRTSWYENGQIRGKSIRKDGRYNGLCTYWYENGQKKSEVEYENGLKDGVSISWHDNGQIKRETKYSNGKIIDKQKLWSKNGDEFEVGIVTDVDGNIYQTIKVGDQWWMMENLRVTHYSNLEPIPLVSESRSWWSIPEGAYCMYENKKYFIEIYSLLYNFYAVADKRNIAPKGWHVPSEVEWKQLINSLKDISKERREEILPWLFSNALETNFAGGERILSPNDLFISLNYGGFFWTATKSKSVSVKSRSKDIRIRSQSHSRSGYSIRCVKN